MNNLRTVLENLKSEKIKERQEGISAVRNVFAQDKVVANFHINPNGGGDPRAWLPVFQALFQTVRSEVDLMHKTSTKSTSSSANAERRLSEAASVVRWLTERTAHLLNKAVVRALFDHFLQTMIRRGMLLSAVALDYAKALRCLVTYTPHLEHMEDEIWIDMVQLAFNVVMNDSVAKKFQQDPKDGSPSRATEPDDLDLYLEDDPMEEDDDDLPSTRKRARKDSTPTQVPSSSKMRSQPGRSSRTPVQQVSVTLESVEFMSLLSVLLRSPSSPLLSEQCSYLPSSILQRLQRFLDIYPPDTSLQHDYLLSLSSILATLSLNKKHIVQKFARASWDGLVRLWGTKNKRMKEGIIVVLRLLFPFVISDNDPLDMDSAPFDCVESIGRLWNLLNGEAESRWGVVGLSLDCLRLELVKPHCRSDEIEPFVANTFRSGWGFDEGQALAWAMLELQADCASKLFLLSESIHPSTPSNARFDGKRVKLENPITSILASILGQFTTAVRVYHLQILLFFIDRHWLLLHETLQCKVIQMLLQFVSYDEGVVQSWVFLCFAAVAYASSFPEASRSIASTPEGLLSDPIMWESLWTNAIRRVNVPIVCRAACHAAHALLHSHIKATGTTRMPLSSQRVLLEIETLGKDLDVQGPAYPYDSVCAFLAQCIQVANQDMRLYRMHLEEKLLSWLVDSWKVVNMVKRMSLYLVKDIMLLLEGICGLTKKSDLVSRVPLPQCQITDMLTEQAKTKVIRDFLMDARLPIFHKPLQAARTSTAPETVGGSDTSGRAQQLIQPRGRERKISAFLLKSLEALFSDREDSTSHTTAEKARLSLDVAITALSFESSLVLNGTQADRRVVQHACKLINNMTVLLLDTQWTVGEKALILLGLDPLVSTGNEDHTEDGWDAMLLPGVGSGIKAQTLEHLTSDRENRDSLSTMRMDFLRVIWKNADIQDAFNNVISTIRSVLRAVLDPQSSVSPAYQTNVVDNDGFGPIRTTTTRQTSNVNQDGDASYFSRCVLEVCIAFLTVGPALQSASGEPTRDKSLTDMVLSCAESRPSVFLLVCPILFQKTRQGFVNLSIKNLDGFLDELGSLLQLYEYARSRSAQLLVAQFLDSTLNTWASQQIVMGEVLGKVQHFCDWLSVALKKQKIRDWSVRDFLARFLDRYLARDPDQSVWSDPEEEQHTKNVPDTLLPMMTADEDIRVRFRAAVINARLFTVARDVGRSAVALYNSIKEWYTVDLDDYERMLTRMLSLGNIMVISSAVRRGPYWHLLETCIHTLVYSRHIECILARVSERLGLDRFSLLFESYAAQLAFSIRQADSDLLRFPPHILGYHDRKECAKATFRMFTPTNIWNKGQKLFKGHCKVLDISPEDGLHECFGDILGYQIVTWIDENREKIEGLDELLRARTFDGNEFEEHLAQNMDGIVAFILGTLDEQDFSDKGPIMNTLRSLGNDPKNNRISQVFQALVKYRRIEDFDSHPPNLPAFPTESVLHALSWLHSRLTTVDTRATTYHILHQMFAQIEQSPLVNEQVRLMNAMSLWISCNHEEFQDATLLQTLIHGATSLLKQSDLARSAQSILEWAFDIYREERTKDSSFPNVIIRIACLAHDYAADPAYSAMSELGQDLVGWMDAQALKLARVSELSSQILRVLPAWPYDPSPQLSKLSESVTAENLSAVLEDHRVSSNKFRLVRRLHNFAKSKDYDESRFAKSDFWRLKECMPPKVHLQEADIDAFIALIYLNKGRTNSFDSEMPNSGSLLSKHKRSLQKQGNTATMNTDKAQEAITLTLLAMLRDDSAHQAHVAYNTLRLIKSVPVKGTDRYALLPSEYEAELRYLEAYRRSPKTKPSYDVRERLTSESFFCSSRDFSQWIGGITILLSDILSEKDDFFAQLTSILQSIPDFAEQILPVLVHTVLQTEQASMQSQDKPYRVLLSNYFTSVLSSDFASIPCLRSIVNVVLHLRHFPFTQLDALSYNKWLNIDFTLLARSAIKYGAYTTALLFLELAGDDPNRITTDHVWAEEQILYEIYRHIDEPDGFYGISDNDLHQFLIKRFHHEKQWDKAFQFHGAALEAGSMEVSDSEGLVKSFHSFGFDGLAIHALQTSTVTETAHAPSTSYRLGWRTETWDLPDHGEASPGSSLYVALRAIHRERDASSVNHIITTTMSNEIDRLRSLGSENFAEIREVVQELLCLREVKQWRHEFTGQRLVSKDVDTKQWPELTEINLDFEFSHLENIMATRISLLRSVRRNEERQQIGTLITPFTQGLMDIEKGCLVRLSEAARNVNQIQIALNSVIRAQRLENTPSFAVLQEFSNVLWRQKEEQVAVQLLERLVSQGSQPSPNATIGPAQKAVLLARLGTWSSQACLKNPTDIQDQYFKKATAVLDDMRSMNPSDSQDAHAIVYHECAMFAERQYHAILQSSDVLRWKVYAERKQQEINSRSQEILKASTQVRRQALETDQTKAKKLFDEDIQLFRTHNTARDTFLMQAIDMYSRCLHASDSFDSDSAIRLCSLWFANFEELGGSFQDDVQTGLERIPSRKFIFLVHQLSARISKPQVGNIFKNQENLQHLVLRMCRDHPFHSLYQVYCLRSGRQSSSSTRRQSGRHSAPTAQTEREDAALEIFDRLRTEPTSQTRVLEVERLCDACIQWAEYSLKNNAAYKIKSHKSFPVPTELLLRKISKMRIPVITHHLPLDTTMRYNDYAWVERYEPNFETAGGVNLPKISVCYDSSGQKHKQLFKGNDDLRQDAVMEQVFELVNTILRRNRETKRRDLTIRDYKVIPLGPQAGVLEFVGNTIPLANWLRAAHARYHPDDMSYNQAVERMTNIRVEAGKGLFKDPNKSIEDHFKDVIQKEFHPVMRHYFTEKHRTPISWFAKRLNYTRSVATTSIVGHVLGLGDRHISNILLDNASGQVVHIDLGIAFDQGKYLRVPELVPFRMTRDMVDGMGSSGTKGVFQRCAEETLRVLREDSEVIRTVLEVFKYDPLHSWTASEIKVQRVQREVPTDPSAAGSGRFGFGLGIDMSSGSAEEAADRALNSVNRKLDKSLSVEYTVNQLVTAATSTTNLSLIFPGWSPHC